MTGDHGNACNRANPELYLLSDLCPLIAELRRAKRASGATWVRLFGKSIHARNLGCDVSVRLSAYPPVRPSGKGKTGVPGEKSLRAD